MISDKTIHKAFRVHKTIYKQNPFFFFFFLNTIYQNCTLAFSITVDAWLCVLDIERIKHKDKAQL